MRLEVAAAVLELLVSTSLMLQPIDIDALTYLCKTARLLQVTLLVYQLHSPRKLMPQCVR